MQISPPEPANLPFLARYTALSYAAMVLPAVLVARGGNILFAGLLLAATIGFFFRSRQLLPIDNSRQGADNPHHVLYAGFAFSAFAALSSLWSIVPAISLQKGVVLALMSAATFLVMRTALQTDLFTLRQACLGFLVSMAIGAVFLAIELVSDQRIVRWLIELYPQSVANHTNIRVIDGKVAFLWNGDLNRTTCVVALLIVPAIMAARAAIATPWLRWAAMGWFAALIFAILWKAEHQSSQLALAGGLAILALGLLRTCLARWGFQAGWAALLLAVIPLSLMLYQEFELHKERRVFDSAASRVVVWGHTAEKILDNPILGIGAHATSALNNTKIDKGKFKTVKVWTRDFPVLFNHHAHNVYLQTWFELGAIGAALLLIWGLIAARVASTLPLSEQVPWYAQMTVTALMAATSYGFWQFWFQAAIASAFILLWMATLVQRDAKS